MGEFKDERLPFRRHVQLRDHKEWRVHVRERYDCSGNARRQERNAPLTWCREHRAPLRRHPLRSFRRAIALPPSGPAMEVRISKPSQSPPAAMVRYFGLGQFCSIQVSLLTEEGERVAHFRRMTLPSITGCSRARAFRSLWEQCSRSGTILCRGPSLPLKVPKRVHFH